MGVHVLILTLPLLIHISIVPLYFTYKTHAQRELDENFPNSNGSTFSQNEGILLSTGPGLLHRVHTHEVSPGLEWGNCSFDRLRKSYQSPEHFRTVGWEETFKFLFLVFVDRKRHQKFFLVKVTGVIATSGVLCMAIEWFYKPWMNWIAPGSWWVWFLKDHTDNKLLNSLSLRGRDATSRSSWVIPAQALRDDVL